MASKVRQGNYITIQGWMVTDLFLKGNELLIYAIIYGFSQTDNQVFTGSLQYLADWTSTSKQTVITSLKALIEKGYIVKSEKTVNGVKFCEYYSNFLNGVVKNFEWGYSNNLNGGIQNSLPNNIGNIHNDKTKNNNRFTKPTLEEVQAYCKERNNNVDAQKWYDYYEAVGWKVGKNPMKDWKASVRTWERGNTNGTNRTSNKVSFNYDQFTE